MTAKIGLPAHDFVNSLRGGPSILHILYKEAVSNRAYDTPQANCRPDIIVVS